jgi:hypothetical protein
MITLIRDRLRYLVALLNVEQFGLWRCVHLPQIDVLDGHLSRQRIVDTVAAARACGAVALSANDHFAFPVPSLDGLVALSAAAQSSGPLDLMTSLDYSLGGQPFEERWSRFDAAIVRLRELLGASEPTDPSPPPAALAVARLTTPVWVASWGSPAGLRRVARFAALARALGRDVDELRRSFGMQLSAASECISGLWLTSRASFRCLPSGCCPW